MRKVQFFDWDHKKDSANLKKHGVSFEEASEVFYDEDAILIYDADHSHTEDRFLLLGLSMKPKLLIVCHCAKDDGDTIRIISARKANKSETVIYRGRSHER